VHVAGESGTTEPVLADPEWDYKWVAARPDAEGILAVRLRAGSDYRANEVSEIVERDSSGAVQVLRTEPGRITSLQAFEQGAYAYFVSVGLEPVLGCTRNCRYMPTALKMILVGSD